MTFVEETTRRLFSALEREGVRYAYLRNYEHLFSLRSADGRVHTDIDLVVDSRDLPRWRTILTKVSTDAGWHAVTECDHWARSAVRHHNIEVFRLYRREPLFCLQIDLFHGLHVLGTPLFDERDLLANRLRDEALGVTRIDPAQENIFRLIQIAGLYPGSQPKVERYRRKIVAYLGRNEEAFRNKVRRIFGRGGARALASLVEGDYERFQRRMLGARLLYVARYLASHPLETPRKLIHRVRDQISRFYSNQCGCAVGIHATGEETRALVRSVLNEMVERSFMDEWIESRRSVIGWREHVLMEQGAWIVTWSDQQQAAIDLGSTTDRALAIDRIFRFLLSRHRALGSGERVPEAAHCT